MEGPSYYIAFDEYILHKDTKIFSGGASFGHLYRKCECCSNHSHVNEKDTHWSSTEDGVVINLNAGNKDEAEELYKKWLVDHLRECKTHVPAGNSWKPEAHAVIINNVRLCESGTENSRRYYKTVREDFVPQARV